MEVQGVALQNEAAKVFWNKTISHGSMINFEDI
jgi:hypothetical protein